MGRMTTTITLTQGQRIRYAREAAGLDQDELAELLHISRPALSAWERDKNKRGVSFNDLEAVAKHTGFNVQFFLDKKATFTSTLTDWELCDADVTPASPQVDGQMSLLAA